MAVKVLYGSMSCESSKYNGNGSVDKNIPIRRYHQNVNKLVHVNM